MKITLKTHEGIAKRVIIECKPLEYLTIKKALDSMANHHPEDILAAQRLAEVPIRTEEEGIEVKGDEVEDLSSNGENKQENLCDSCTNKARAITIVKEF